jgi:hypothetical protein
MSLLRLLTAGKSLVGLKEPEAGYRMTDPRSMPKFGSAKNPFSRAQKPEAAVSQAVKEISAEPAVQKRSGVCETQRGDETRGLVLSGSLRKNTLRLSETRPTAATAVKTETRKPRESTEAGGQLGSLVKKLKPLLSFRVGKKPAAARSEPRPVQGELSLDKVTVLRNDLSDADVVIVRKKVQTAADPGFVFAEKPASPQAVMAAQVAVNS